MTTDVVAEIIDQSADELTAIVRQILGEDAAPVGDLSTSDINRGFGTATAGIYRVAGRATTSDGVAGWSAAVKALGTPATDSRGREVGDDYREVEVYRSGVFDELHGGVRAAHCYAIQERDDLLLLWLEDLTGAPHAPWEPEQYVATARHLGQFNAYWPEDALPKWEWLSHTGFRNAFTGNPRVQGNVERLPANAGHPFMRAYLAESSVDEITQLFRDCDDLLQVAETTARGISHRDCHPKNLFPVNGADGDSYTVGVDWVQVGPANYGVDVGHLLSSPTQHMHLSVEAAADLLEPVFDAYVAGLRDSGWTGDADGALVTYLARIALTAIRNLSLTTLNIENDRFRQQMENAFPILAEEIGYRWGQHIPFFLQCRDEAMAVAERH